MIDTVLKKATHGITNSRHASKDPGSSSGGESVYAVN